MTHAMTSADRQFSISIDKFPHATDYTDYTDPCETAGRGSLAALRAAGQTANPVTNESRA